MMNLREGESEKWDIVLVSCCCYNKLTHA
jgi:predicted nicotinamide N-methyase